MKKKLLIIGKKSFIGENIYYKKKNKLKIKVINFLDFKKKKYKYLLQFNFILNCTSNKKYVKNRYSVSNDHDYFIAKKIRNSNCKYIFLSTRKVYKSGYNLKETSKIKPLDNYSKNKFKTENKLKFLLGRRLIILRISNVIGFKKKTKNRIHKTFIDNFFENIKNGNILKIKNEYKDFIAINDFCMVIYKIINKELTGTYNVSLGRKIYIKTIIKWLNLYNPSKYKTIKMKKYHNNDSFTLNNEKLQKATNMKISVNNLKKECKRISKYYFKKQK